MEINRFHRIARTEIDRIEMLAEFQEFLIVGAVASAAAPVDVMATISARVMVRIMSIVN